MIRTTKLLLEFLFLTLCLSLLASGCAVGPDFVRPEPPGANSYNHGADPAATTTADGKAQSFDRGTAMTADWWRLFNSSQLDVVINDAIAGNPNLQAAQASLRQSQDNLRAGYGIFFPTVDAGFDATRQKLSPYRFGGGAPGSIFNLYTLQATVNYTLDFFGGERRAVEGLQAQVDFQQNVVRGTYLALTGNVVNTLIAHAAYREQVKVAEQIIDYEREQVGIAEVQAEAGAVPFSNVLSLRSQLASAEATLLPLRQKLYQAEHLLATLTGHAPAEWAPPQVGLADITLPLNLPVTLPSELVRQRPDILAAEAQLHSASAGIGVATAALLPSFSINASYGRDNTALSNILNKAGGIWSLGADVVAPLFHGGALRFKREAAIEGYNQSAASYRQTVLNAFAQVADTLLALENDAKTLEAQSNALSAAEEALHLVQANYAAGVANYLQVLAADEQYNQANAGYVQAKAQRLQDTVALFVALGGGWWNGEAGR
ncbi:MAG: efflux transporter outer membrane subunit [Nitrospirae bacterium]|nr:efflux transporter outer membrane subunit [Nitrospirota bacterium]